MGGRGTGHGLGPLATRGGRWFGRAFLLLGWPRRNGFHLRRAAGLSGDLATLARQQASTLSRQKVIEILCGILAEVRASPAPYGSSSTASPLYDSMRSLRSHDAVGTGRASRQCRSCGSRTSHRQRIALHHVLYGVSDPGFAQAVAELIARARYGLARSTRQDGRPIMLSRCFAATQGSLRSRSAACRARRG